MGVLSEQVLLFADKNGMYEPVSIDTVINISGKAIVKTGSILLKRFLWKPLKKRREMYFFLKHRSVIEWALLWM